MIEATPMNTRVDCLRHSKSPGQPCVPSGHPNTLRFPGHICGQRYRRGRHV